MNAGTEISYVGTRRDRRVGQVGQVLQGLDLAPLGIGVWLINPGFVRTRLTARNDFAMPALLTPQQAAMAVLQGFAAGKFEIHFPKRFTCLMKLLAHLPYRWYFPLMHRFTGL